MKKGKVEKMAASWKETSNLLGRTKQLTFKASTKLSIKATDKATETKKMNHNGTFHPFTTDKNTKEDDQRIVRSLKEIDEIQACLKETIDSHFQKINTEADIEKLCKRTKDTEITFSTKLKKYKLGQDQSKKNARLFCLLSILCPCFAPCFLPAACYNWHK